jgi:hypothetical protein
MTGGPSPMRSNAIVVPSFEVTVSIRIPFLRRAYHRIVRTLVRKNSYTLVFVNRIFAEHHALRGRAS